MFSTPRKRVPIIAGFVIGNLLVLSLGGYFLYQSRQQYEQRARIATQNIAQAIDQSLSNSIEKINLALCAVTDELEEQLAGGGIREGVIKTMLATYEQRILDLDGMRVTNAAGVVVYGKGVDHQTQASYGDRDFFTYLRDHADAGLQVTKPIEGRVSRKSVIAFVRRYNLPDGSFGGVVSGAVTLDHFHDLLSRFDIGPHGGMTLRDTDLGQIARYPRSPDGPSATVGNTVVSPKLRELVRSGVSKSTYYTRTPIDQTERILTFHRLHIAPMIATVGLARQDYLAEWNREVLKTGLLVGSFALLSLVSAVTLLRFLNQISREGARNRLYLKNASDGIHILDESGTVVEVSDKFCAMLGYGRDEMIGMNADRWASRWPADILAAEILPRLLVSEETEVFETLHRRKNGDAVEVEVNVAGILMEGKRYLYASSRDITERKLAQHTLEHERVRLRTLLQTIPDLVWLKDPDGVYLACNNRFERFFGAKEADILGRTDYDFVDTELADFFRANDRKAIEADGPSINEERVTYADDGHSELLETIKTPMRDDQGNLVGVLGIARDITEMRRAEESLRESEARYRDLVDVSPYAIYVHQNGRFVFVNPAGCLLLGAASPGDLIGEPILERVHPDYRDFVTSRVGAAQASGQTVPPLEELFLRLDGTSVAVEVVATTLTYHGEPAMQVLACDITERKRLEVELIRGQKLESLGVLAGGIAHDFNNILTGILGNISFARMLVSDDHKAAQRLAECEKAAKRAGELTQQLLTFARGGEPVRKSVDTGRLIEESLSFALRGANVKGTVDCPPDIWWLDADAGQMSQVFNNLLINSKQAMPQGGSVTIKADNLEVHGGGPLAVEPGRYVRISITDQGSGIAPEYMARIFDPYFTTKSQGSGLGLASVYSIIKRHGGMITAASRQGEGSSFTLLIPAMQGGANEYQIEDQPISLLQGTGRILVMDDEELIRELLATMLEELGYAVVICTNGSAAVALHAEAQEKSNPFAAVILDLTVPGGMGGREAAALIRGRDPQVPLIVSSGYSSDSVIGEYAKHGFSGFVIKPYTLEELASELARCIGGNRNV